MINAINSTNEICYLLSNERTAGKLTKRPKSFYMSSGDRYVNNNTKNNLAKALTDGSLVYTEPTKLLGLITLREGFYTYTPESGETIGQIKQKFGIKDDVIGDMNGIYDDDVCPVQIGKKSINFRLEE